MKNFREACASIDFNPKVELVEENGKEKLYLYGSIVEEVPIDWWTGEEMSGDYITMDKVKEAFNQIKGNDVEIHLNSCLLYTSDAADE